MLTIEIHGLGREDAAGVFLRIMDILSNITWFEKDKCSIETYHNNLVICDDTAKTSPQLRLLSSLSKMQNNDIVSKFITEFNYPVYVIEAFVCVHK